MLRFADYFFQSVTAEQFFVGISPFGTPSVVKTSRLPGLSSTIRGGSGSELGVNPREPKQCEQLKLGCYRSQFCGTAIA